MTRRDACGRFRRATDEELGFTPEFRRQIRERFDAACQAENDIRAQAVDDLRFYADEQWPTRER